MLLLFSPMICIALLLLTAADPLAERLVSLSNIEEARVSPDGQTVLFVLSKPDLKTNRNESSLMSVSAGGGAPQTVAGMPSGVGALRWSPDGARVAFFGKRDDKQALWVLEWRSRTLTRVCGYQRPNSYLADAGNWLAWSPDGTRLAFAGTLEAPPASQDPLVITRILFKTRTGFSDNRRSHIYVVPAEGGSPRALTEGGYDEHSLDWGGDGSEIVFLSNREPDPDANFNYDIFAVGVETGAVRRITNSPGVEMDPRVSPDGRWIAYAATKRRITTIDSIAEDAHIWAVPFSGGSARELNRSLDRRSSSPLWDADARSVFFLADDRGRKLLFRVPVEGGASSPRWEADAQLSLVSAARDGTLVFASTDPMSPRDLYRLPAGASEPVRLTRLHAEELTGIPSSAPQRVIFRSFDRTEVEGWLYPPATPSGSWPLILSIHGGPHSTHGYTFNSAFRYYAAKGYAALAINPRGTPGYGQRFSDGSLNDWGGGDYRDLMAGVDHVLRTYPQIDQRRLGVTGGSYGGYMTNWMITQTDRFHAAVSVASLSNLISFYGTSLYQDLIHAEFGGYPWNGRNFRLLWDRSPLSYIRKVKTPTLLLHGELDQEVSVSQSEEMYVAMRQRGIRSVFVRYPREGHGIREPRHRLDALIRTLNWFVRDGASR